jgi:hypothetical protein
VPALARGAHVEATVSTGVRSSGANVNGVGSRVDFGIRLC